MLVHVRTVVNVNVCVNVPNTMHYSVCILFNHHLAVTVYIVKGIQTTRHAVIVADNQGNLTSTTTNLNSKKNPYKVSFKRHAKLEDLGPCTKATAATTAAATATTTNQFNPKPFIHPKWGSYIT